MSGILISHYTISDQSDLRMSCRWKTNTLLAVSHKMLIFQFCVIMIVMCVINSWLLVTSQGACYNGCKDNERLTLIIVVGMHSSSAQECLWSQQDCNSKAIINEAFLTVVIHFCARNCPVSQLCTHQEFSFLTQPLTCSREVEIFNSFAFSLLCKPDHQTGNAELEEKAKLARKSNFRSSVSIHEFIRNVIIQHCDLFPWT